jgi:hypothetical protein
VQHSTPEQWALAALGEPLPPEDAAHLESCADCRAEVASLRRGVELLAVPEFAAPGAPVAPPPAVWASIAAATGVSVTPRTEPAPSTAARPVPAEEPGTAEEPIADVVPLRRRTPRPWLLAVAAAVVGAAVGAGAVAVLQGGDDDGAPLAAAALDPLEDADASGSARVVERADGTRVLEVDLRAPDLQDAYYEVWLLEPDVSGLVPLGTTQAGTTVFEIPAGLDLDQFPVVDVSVEPLDGDPSHSGDSVVRGVLES